LQYFFFANDFPTDPWIVSQKKNPFMELEMRNYILVNVGISIIIFANAKKFGLENKIG